MTTLTGFLSLSSVSRLRDVDLSKTNRSAFYSHTAAQFDGRRTAAEVFEAATRAGRTPADLSLKAFAEFIGQMVERAVLDIDMPDGAPRHFCVQEYA